MHDSSEESVRENYRRSIRANRRETIRELKSAFGLDGPGGPSTPAERKEALGGLAVALAIAALVYGAWKYGGQDSAPPQAAERPAAQATQQDGEMGRKYEEAVRRESRARSPYYEYARDCGPDVSREKRRHCADLERRIRTLERRGAR
ncbi:MAG: hypothetical protein AB1529_07080 [Candidatus Micrarchaeota archaeon]